MTPYCPTHHRIWQPPSLTHDVHPGYWRPLRLSTLAWAWHLAQQGGCADQISVTPTRCDLCPQEETPYAPTYPCLAGPLAAATR